MFSSTKFLNILILTCGIVIIYGGMLRMPSMLCFCTDRRFVMVLVHPASDGRLWDLQCFTAQERAHNTYLAENFFPHQTLFKYHTSKINLHKRTHDIEDTNKRPKKPYAIIPLAEVSVTGTTKTIYTLQINNETKIKYLPKRETIFM